MPLGEMERRFEHCDNVEKTILRAIKSLYICGIYEESQVFSLRWIRIVNKKHGLEGKDFEWVSWLESLRGKELITLGRDKVYWLYQTANSLQNTATSSSILYAERVFESCNVPPI